MIKVSVLYPHFDGARFDMAYYLEKHMAIVRRMFGSALKGLAVEEGLGGGQPGSAPTYLAMCHLQFESIEAFQTAIAGKEQQLMSDIPNYTTIDPVFQISEVKL